MGRISKKLEIEKNKLDELLMSDVDYQTILKQSQIVDELITEYYIEQNNNDRKEATAFVMHQKIYS